MRADGQAKWYSVRTWRGRALIAFGAFALLVVIFHRPILLTVGEAVARHYAAKEHLKLDLHLEGSVFTNLTVRHLHAVPTGDTPVESLDVEFAHFTYSIGGLIRHRPDSVKTVDIRSARFVLDPARVKLKRPPPPDEKIKLPGIFPEVIQLSDVTLLIKDKPYDTLIEHVYAYLDPHQTRDLRVDRVQLAAGQNFTHVSGQTSYTNRNLILRNLEMGGDRIQLVNVDASLVAERKTLGVKVETDLGGGKVLLTGSLREASRSLQVDAHLNATAVAAEALNKYIGSDVQLGGQIEQLQIDGTGIFNSPKTWTADASARLQGFRNQNIGVDSCTLQVKARDGHAVIQSADVVQGENRIQVRGSAVLPENMQEFARAPANLEISADAVDLARMTADLPYHLTGAADLRGTVKISNAQINGEVVVTGGPVGFPDGTVEKLSATVTASKVMPAAGKEKAWFADLRTKFRTEITNIRFKQYAIDAVQGEASSVDDVVRLEQLSVRRVNNELNVRGEYRLPADINLAPEQPASVDVSLNAPQLADYWVTNTPDRVSGPLQMGGQLEWREKLANGQFMTYGGDLKMRDLVFRLVSSQVSITNSVVYLNDLTAALNERDFVRANGQFDLRGKHSYSGKLSANIANLSTLKPMLRAAGNENELGGSFAINWEGAGEAATIHNNGKLQVTLEKGRYGDAQPLQAKIDANYTPEGLDVPIIFFASNKMDFQAIAQAKGETFEISKIELNQGQAKYASGYASIPFIWKNIGTNTRVFPPNGKVSITFQSENIEIKKLFEDIGAKPPGSGTINLKVDAHGTLDQLEARLDFQARNLRTEMVPKLEPASFDLTAEARGDKLNLVGKLQQPKIQPMELTATLPFDAAKVLHDRGLSDDTPVIAKLRVPRSSVNFLRQFIPEIEQLDGDLGMDVDVKGTVGKPILSGSADMTVNVARSSNVTLPALRSFKARLSFANDALTFQEFGGELSGGRFTVTGGVKFPRLTKADIDLRLRGDSVLVARNDTITARANADVKVVGPLTSASVTGTVEMTNSQFLKNLDLIPIGLPGRPAPQPPSDRPDISFPQPPLRDWKFDVAIKTKDPFLIRGNLANGGAIADLRLVGTGLHPGLKGQVRLEKVEATLPFSRLEIAYGFLYFDPSDSFNPKMDLHGTSVIRDYTIHVYIYGTSLAPQAIFTSEPPLPQEEVISLLATGTTREQLTGNNNVLAGRAAMLLVQQLYRKVFKTGQSANNSSVFDRLDVDVGQVDPRTGQQQATARFKINDQFVLVGDLDVGGGFRGMVKYLIRFR